MPAFYRAAVPEFLGHEVDLVIGRLSTVTRLGLSELTAEQLEAWRSQLTILRSALVRFSDEKSQLLLEYPIPRRGKRIDAVIIVGNLILVIEFKCGARKYDRQAQIQVEDYCLDLRDFHSGSRGRLLIPILIATRAEDHPPPPGEIVDSVAPIWFANAGTVATVLADAIARYHTQNCELIDAEQWDTAQYVPTPTIVEAARVLYEGQNVREISRCHAGAE